MAFLTSWLRNAGENGAGTPHWEVWRRAYSMTSRQQTHDPDMAKKHTNSVYLQSTLSPPDSPNLNHPIQNIGLGGSPQILNGLKLPKSLDSPMPTNPIYTAYPSLIYRFFSG